MRFHVRNKKAIRYNSIQESETVTATSGRAEECGAGMPQSEKDKETSNI